MIALPQRSPALRWFTCACGKPNCFRPIDDDFGFDVCRVCQWIDHHPQIDARTRAQLRSHRRATTNPAGVRIRPYRPDTRPAGSTPAPRPTATDKVYRLLTLGLASSIAFVLYAVMGMSP